MSDRTDTRDSATRTEEAEVPIEENLEEASEEARDDAPAQEAVLDVLLRRSGVLPEHPETGEFDDETELPAGRREGEFVCSSCFLIKPNSQMGDADRRMCRDCVDPPHAKHVA